MSTLLLGIDGPFQNNVCKILVIITPGSDEETLILRGTGAAPYISERLTGCEFLIGLGFLNCSMSFSLDKKNFNNGLP